MLIVHGKRLYGKVDEVPGLFYVATKFYHFWFLPVIPLGSHIVLSKTDRGWRGVPCGLSLKSVAAAWLRVVTPVLLVIGLVSTIAAFNTPHPYTAVPTTVVCLLLASCLFWWSYARSLRPSYKRAHRLVDKLEVSDDARLMVDVALGYVSQADADAARAGVMPKELPRA